LNITVRLFASLREGRFVSRLIPIADGSAVRDALILTGVSINETAVLFVNGRHALPETLLAEGDSLGVFPPVGGG
jgi:sulfur carrier protein